MIDTTLATAQIIEPLSPSIVKINLLSEKFIPFKAGQYLKVHLGEDLYYSIANLSSYELHVRKAHNNTFLEYIKLKPIKLTLPFGRCIIDNLDLNNPIIFLAQGTGFAPIKAMIEDLLARNSKTPFELYWVVKSCSDFYLQEPLLDWQKKGALRHLVQKTSLKNDLLPELALAQHGKNLKFFNIVIAGPFDMVYKSRDFLTSHGISEKNIHSDAFEFELIK